MGISRKKLLNITAVIAVIVAIISVSLFVYSCFFQDRTPGELGVENYYSYSDINRNDEYIRYVMPSESKYYNSGSTVTVTASVRKDAVVVAYVGSSRMPMVAQSESTDGYSVYSCNYIIPEGTTINPGMISVEASYNGITQVEYGGIVMIAQSQNTTTTNVVNPRPTVSGTEISGYPMIQVTGNSVECRMIKNNDLYYNPNYPELITGMTDYVTGTISCEDGGKTVTMYKLLSGRLIEAEDENITYTAVGQTRDYNTLGAVSATNNDGLSVSIGTQWKAPYETRFVNQNYTTGYEKLDYNVKNFCATAIDFVFSNTKAFTGTVPAMSGNIISSAELLQDSAAKTVTLRCHFKTPGMFYGYTVGFDNAGNYVIHFNEPHKTLSGLKVIIDPGHGGNSGAISTDGSKYESIQVLAIGKFLAGYLADSGASVYMTRTAAADVSLEARRAMARQINPDLFISIHLNASEDTSRNGTSTFYYNAFSAPFAEGIHNRLVSTFSNNCYKNEPKMLSRVNQGINYYPFLVTRHTVCPSVLIEVGYISNPLEYQYLSDSAYQQLFAYAIYSGIYDYVSSRK